MMPVPRKDPPAMEHSRRHDEPIGYYSPNRMQMGTALQPHQYKKKLSWKFWVFILGGVGVGVILIAYFF